MRSLGCSELLCTRACRKVVECAGKAGERHVVGVLYHGDDEAPVERDGDALDELSRLFNEMLDRIEGSHRIAIRPLRGESVKCVGGAEDPLLDRDPRFYTTEGARPTTGAGSRMRSACWRWR